MDIQMERKTLRIVSAKSHMLAKQAKREQRLTGVITVVCPKCDEKPEITTTSNGERTIVSCKCGYVYDAEMNL